MAKEYFEIVDGYVFRSDELAKQARMELEGIRFVKTQIDMDNPHAILQVYNRIIEDGLFHTEVGYSFLRQLQEYLKASPDIDDEAVRALEVSSADIRFSDNQRPSYPKEQVHTGMLEKMKHRLITAYIIIATLGVLVVSMILIMRNSDNATILNYENKVIDRYEHWQEELEEREEAIEEKEKELGIRP